MPEIQLSDELYERLGGLARPFESPAEVIQRLIDEKERLQPIRATSRKGPGRGRRPRGNSLRGAVTRRWEDMGNPNWNVDDTIRISEEEDEAFRQAGKSPAPRFREERDRGNVTYVRTWVYGCHFPWLNPR